MNPEFHPLANLFPLIEGKDFDEFCAGIAADGRLHDKIVLFEGKILDGRNRWRACERLGMTAHWHTFNPEIEGDPLTFVISKNLHRRHLSPSQRALVAAEIETYRHGGDRRSADQDANLHLEREDAARAVGVSERSVATAAGVRDHAVDEVKDAVRSGGMSISAAAEIASLPEDEQRAILAEVAKAPDTKKAFSGVVKELRREKQDEKKQKRKDKVRDLGDGMRALPDKKFGVILADPEWPFEVWSEDTGQDRAAANHYPTSTVDVIRSRPVADIAADECVLGLWATVPKLPAALDVMREWGFTYVTNIAWIKDRIGTGYWFRNNHEILLIGKKGKPPKPADGTQWRSAIEAPRGAHSEKPDFQYEFFETFFPGWPAIELNARRRRDGWDAWGLEAPDPDTGEIIEQPPQHGADTSVRADSETDPGVGPSTLESGPLDDGGQDMTAGAGVRVAPAPVVPEPIDIELPDSLRRVAMTEDERRLVASIDIESLALNQKLMVRKLRDHPEAFTALDRTYLARIGERVAA